MRDTLPFMVRLGLLADTNAKDVRRAYARELKKIDQTADPAGFQELRTVYEVALHWLAHQQAEQPMAAAPIPAVHEPAAPPEPELLHDDPYQLANQAFMSFASSMESLLQGGHARHQSRWKSALQASLDDHMLLNLTARSLFEARVVHLLASGWKPGHETLFVVACEVFDWTRDARGNMQFGDSGAMVNRAIDEWKKYESLPASAINKVKQLIQVIRTTPKAEGTAARNDLIQFHRLAGSFYNWFAIIIDRATLQEWSNAAQAEVQRAGPVPADPLKTSRAAREFSKKSSWGVRFAGSMVFIIFLLIKGCAAFINTPSALPDNVSSSRAQQDDEEIQLGLDPASPPETVPTKAQLQAVRDWILYFPDPAKMLGVLKVSFIVELDDQGKVIDLKKIGASRDPEFDNAVARALRRTNTFLPGTQRKFLLSYSHKVGRS